MNKIKRNKSCPNCPKNKREDIVWEKGAYDGWEVCKLNFKKIFWRFYWIKYPSIRYE